MSNNLVVGLELMILVVKGCQECEQDIANYAFDLGITEYSVQTPINDGCCCVDGVNETYPDGCVDGHDYQSDDHEDIPRGLHKVFLI